jgi:hypothetical protein
MYECESWSVALSEESAVWDEGGKGVFVFMRDRVAESWRKFYDG